MLSYHRIKNAQGLHESLIFNDYLIGEFFLILILIFLSICLPLFSKAQYITTVGANSAGTGTTGSGNTWSNPTNIYTSNNSDASHATTSTRTKTNQNKIKINQVFPLEFFP